MRKHFLIIVFLTVVFIGYIVHTTYTSPKHAVQKTSHVLISRESKISEKPIPAKRAISKTFTGALYNWVGSSTDDLLKAMGKPVRKDSSAYGYTWWVYTDQKHTYIQFGVEDKKVKTIFAAGKNVSIEPMKIGDSYKKLQKKFPFNNKILYTNGINSYEFHLSKEDVQSHPLTQITNNLYMENYFDTFTDELVAIRMMTGEVLLKHRAYEMQYRGPLPKEPILDKKRWRKIEKGMEKQIFDLSNVLRNYYGKKKLKWDDKVQEVAYLHSKDMAERNYFSHYALDGRGLKERLEENQVFYVTAGENIAAEYPDAPAAMLGWLNSKGHREALLNANYTHLGVGVYRFHFTQNFLGKP